MRVYITVDTEVWPVNSGGWPMKPLPASYGCEREIAAYYYGETNRGTYGLPYQVDMLRRHGLVATYFIDPLFSYALGIDVLRRVIDVVESGGQKVALHLHPEWLTDPRCRGLGLPEFRGPLISQYPVEVQRQLIRTGMQRLREAGATPLSAFRSGSWGGDLSTLQALAAEGVRIDCSLNAHILDSLPSLATREELHEPTPIEGVLEYPLTRIDDRSTPRGRPLSFVGVSWSELRFALQQCKADGRENVVIVMHSNEFVQTERLWGAGPVRPRRNVVARFERFCDFMGRDGCIARTAWFDDVAMQPPAVTRRFGLPKSTLLRTLPRLGSQFIHRWI
jgi:hypothetical protein